MNSEEEMLKWEEPSEIYYTKEEYPLQEETYELIGICMEVHRILGRGFLEVVYKDAIEHELKLRNIFYEREKVHEVIYKGAALKHTFTSDFIVYGKIVLEVKSQNGTLENHYPQALNYLAATKLKVALLVNFGEKSLKQKRIIL